MSVGPSASAAASSSRPYLWFPVACSAVAWAVVFVTIPPARQEFPLTDDWAFAHGVFRFAAGEGIHYYGWSAMPQLGQWLWAWPFVKCFGASFTALRGSTIVLSWFGLAGFGSLLRAEDWAPWEAAFGAAVLAFTPLFFLMQGTFLTDVPALSFVLVALALYQRGLANGGWRAFVGAAAVAVLAALTRQTTLAAPAAVGLLWLRRRPAGAIGLLAVTVPLAVGLLAHTWLQSRADILTPPFLTPSPLVLVSVPFILVHFLGLCAMPLLVLVPRRGSGRGVAGAALLLAGIAVVLWRFPEGLPYGPLFPYSNHVLMPWGAFGGQLVPGDGLEPLVPGTRPLLLDPWPNANPWARLVLTALGCLAGASLLVRACGRPGSSRWASLPVLFALLHVPLLVFQLRVDRYFLPLIPGALVLAGASVPGPRRWLPALLLLAASAALSAALMHDWLAWNAARWALGRRAVAQGIPAGDIEGGFEWDGWYASFPRPVRAGPKQLRLVLASSSVWFAHVTGRYALSFSPLPGSRPLDTEPY